MNVQNTQYFFENKIATPFADPCLFLGYIVLLKLAKIIIPLIKLINGFEPCHDVRWVWPSPWLALLAQSLLVELSEYELVFTTLLPRIR